MKADLGIIGLGVMGTSLARNLSRNDFRLSLFNRYLKGSEEQVAQQKIEKYKELKNATPFEDMESFVASLSKPRRVLLTLTAGSAVDGVIEQLIPFLAPGDLIIDGGNSHYTDTERRLKEIESHGMYFLGLGISGGESGALH
ncbi:MAG: NAD(P)-binding domain-containing protein, partial [Flavobacteriaceae bacterium]